VDRFSIQESQYEFPYHYLPHLGEGGTAWRSRALNWGLEYLCYQLHVRELVLALTPDSVLELGCGDGKFIGGLGATVKRRVGVDLAHRAIAYARAFNPGTEFLTDVSELGTEQFDVVAAIEVLEHIPDAEMKGFLSMAFEKTRAGGVFVVSVPTDVRPVHKKHYRHYNESKLRAHVVDAGLSCEWLSVQHVYATPWWVETYLRWTCNRHLVADIPLLNRQLWNRIWRNRVSSAGKGCHMVVVLRKLA